MKKLFIITDIDQMDARYHIKDKVIGTVIRAEVAHSFDSLDGKRMAIDPDGSAFGYAWSDNRLWYDDEAIGYKYWCHASIKVKPLQEED